MKDKASSKRVSTENHNTNSGEGLRINASAGLPQLPLGSKKALQQALEESADRELALTLQIYDLRHRLQEIIDHL